MCQYECASGQCILLDSLRSQDRTGGNASRDASMEAYKTSGPYWTESGWTAKVRETNRVASAIQCQFVRVLQQESEQITARKIANSELF